MPILDDVLSITPANWTPMSYSSKLYYEIEVDDEEKNDVIVNFPSDLGPQVKTVHRIQNPFLWGRYILRKEHLQAKGDVVEEVRHYHPIRSVDKIKVMEYNIDPRRYACKSSSQYDEYAKKPLLYNGPKLAKDALSGVDTLVVMKALETRPGYASFDSLITKDWDTDYYPEYFVGF